MPSEPAMAVSTAMRTLRIFPQLISFDMVVLGLRVNGYGLRVKGERLVVSGESLVSSRNEVRDPSPCSG